MPKSLAKFKLATIWAFEWSTWTQFKLESVLKLLKTSTKKLPELLRVYSSQPMKANSNNLKVRVASTTSMNFITTKKTNPTANTVREVLTNILLNVLNILKNVYSEILRTFHFNSNSNRQRWQFSLQLKLFWKKLETDLYFQLIQKRSSI